MAKKLRLKTGLCKLPAGRTIRKLYATWELDTLERLWREVLMTRLYASKKMRTVSERLQDHLSTPLRPSS